MNLEDLVPPLELCKQIPRGEFRDSFFCYVWCSFREEYLICKSDWEHTQDFARDFRKVFNMDFEK